MQIPMNPGGEIFYDVVIGHKIFLVAIYMAKVDSKSSFVEFHWVVITSQLFIANIAFHLNPVLKYHIEYGTILSFFYTFGN